MSSSIATEGGLGLLKRMVKGKDDWEVKRNAWLMSKGYQRRPDEKAKEMKIVSA